MRPRLARRTKYFCTSAVWCSLAQQSLDTWLPAPHSPDAQGVDSDQEAELDQSQVSTTVCTNHSSPGQGWGHAGPRRMSAARCCSRTGCPCPRTGGRRSPGCRASPSCCPGTATPSAASSPWPHSQFRWVNMIHAQEEFQVSNAQNGSTDPYTPWQAE